MTEEDALDLVEESVRATRKGKGLTTLEGYIVLGTWHRQTNPKIAARNGYSKAHVDDVASRLWQLLSEVWGTKVKKDNFRREAERQYRSQQSIRVSNAQDSVEERVQQAAFDPNFLGREGAIAQESVEERIQQPAFDPNFLGREGAIADLNNLVNQGKKVILIHGKGGVGKTTLASQFFKTQGFGPILKLKMVTETQYISSVEGIIQLWLRHDFNEEPGQEFGVSLEHLRLQLRNSKQRIGVLIDNLEPALEKGKFIKSQRGYVELLRVLGDPDVQSVTLITSRECLREAVVEVEEYRLEGLDEGVWQEVFHNSNIVTDTPALRAMQQAYGGNAKAMNILTKAIQKDFAGDIEEYWRVNNGNLLIERELEDLVASQFNRLQQLDANAYQLLCRLGCYRYQDMQTIPIQGLFCLLWDVPEHQHQRVVKSLADTSLLDFRDREYLLHPVIRAEAIKRLRESEDWETANRKAAEYWTQSVKTVETVQEALKAFEAYYHYVQNQDFNQAASVILKKINTNYSKEVRLGRLLYQLGILETIVSAIIPILNNIDNQYYLSGIYSILGVTYRIKGNIKQAIECHLNSARIANYCLENVQSELSYIEVLENLKIFQLNALLNMGFCQIELWELQEALEIFAKLNTLANDMGLYRHSIGVGLAFINSWLGFKQEASNLAEIVYSEINKKELFGTGYRLVLLGVTYKNLGNINKSFDIYRQAILCADDSGYSSVKAKSLTGLAELYREQGNFETALPHHTESIELLEKIGAKSDLAEAYYQLALTYQKMGDTEKSQPKFQQAIRLFDKMEAPKQVEKVRQAMENG